MQKRRIRLIFACAAVITMVVGSTLPALSEDLQSLQSWGDSYIKKVDAEVAEYLHKHPVRRSLLFDSVSSMVATLGQTKARAIHECEYEPEFPDWEAVIPRLRENTTVALLRSFTEGGRSIALPPPAGQPFVGHFFCDELMVHYVKIISDIHDAGPALVKQGY